jgi:hypothetical protein
MVKNSIGRKQWNTPEELSVQTPAALAAITMKSINGTVWSHSTHLYAIWR